MGCVNSVQVVKNFEVINNKTFENNDDDLYDSLTYIKNLSWCSKVSKYIETLCFSLANYQIDEFAKVKSTIACILSSDIRKTAYGQEFERLCQYIDDVGNFYLECMVCIRRHALNNTMYIFNDVAKCIRIVITSGR